MGPKQKMQNLSQKGSWRNDMTDI